MNDLSINSIEIDKSPFDAIRRFDSQGTEWWSARDLQKMLGYTKWQMFECSIEQGLENLESAVGDVSSHALLLEITLKHQKAKDYKLSRMACYHTALACDSRGKPNVKAAKHYFAVKAYISEVIIPAQNDRLRELELELQLVKAKLECAQAEQKLIDTRHLITSTCPEIIQQKILGYQVVEKIEYRDRVIHDEDIIRDGTTINKTALCRRYGLLKAGKVQYKQINQLLEKLPSEAFRLTATITENSELILNFLPQLDRIFQTEIRQLNLGEE